MKKILSLSFLCAVSSACYLPACGSDDGSGGGGGGGAGSGGSNGGINLGDGGADSSTAGASGDSKQDPIIFEELPDEDYVAANGNGGWKVVGPLSEVKITESAGCANVLRVIARDFPASHPDFQLNGQFVTGIVAEEIGADRKPVYVGADNDAIESADTFNQWYRNGEGDNIPFVMDMWLEPVGDTFVFDSSSFFPLDGYGYALESCTNCEGQPSGFHFTTEMHTSFQYSGGEVFTFRGDDDVWVYLNGKLAIDLGGIHGAIEASVELDDVAAEFGLSVGEVYNFDLFQAERRTSESNFRMETTLDFTNCGTVLDDDVIIR